MADWKYVVATTDGEPVAQVNAFSRQVSWKRDGPAEASWVMNGNDVGAGFVQELLTDLLIYRDDSLMFRGRIGATSDDLTDRHTVQCAAVDYRGLLTQARYTDEELVYLGDSKADIAWALVEHTQGLPGGDLGITRGTGLVPGISDRTYPPDKSIGEAITELGQTINGFEWEIDHLLRFNVWPGERGEERSFVAEHGNTVTSISRAVDPAQYRNVIRAKGDEATTTPYVAAAADIATRPEGRFEIVTSDFDLKEQDAVEERADRNLEVMSVLQPSYSCSLRQGIWDPNELWVGDTTMIVARSLPRLDVATAERIEEIGVNVSDDGEEAVSLTYGVLRRTQIPDALRGIRSRLSQLERR